MTVTVCEAQPDDAAALSGVYRSAYAENRRLGFPATAESATAGTVREWIHEHRVYVAETVGTVVGGVRLERNDEAAKLSRLAVHPGRQGEGIGTRLLARAEAAAREWGCGAVRLTTPPEHPSLPDFYRERGYEEVGPYPLEYRDYDEVVMEKRLG